MNVSGCVIQIIPPDKLDDFFGSKLRDSIKGKFMVVIEEANAPKHIVERFRYRWANKRWPSAWNIVVSECNWKEGDEVSIEVKPFLQMVEFWEC